MALRTLRRMADGGIHDQLGGGFHRYAVDAIWLVPHFEQMLYDNALLARAYLAAWQVTGDEQWREVAEGILDYLLRELALEHGGFASAQDADTDGVEGATFTWTPAQLRAVLSAEDAELAEKTWGVTEEGNFEGATVLSLVAPPEDDAGARAARARARAAARGARRPPAARARRQGAGELERHGAGRAGRGRAPLRPARPAGGGRALRRLPARAAARIRTAGSGARTAPGAARCRASSTTTRRSPSGCTSSTSPRATTATSPSRAASRCWPASASARRTARSSTPRTTPSSSSRARASSTTTRRPSGNSTLAGLLVRLARTYGEPELERRAHAVVEQVGTLLARAPQGFGHLLGRLRRAALAAARGGRRGCGRTIRRRPSWRRRCSTPYEPDLAVAFGDGSDDQRRPAARRDADWWTASAAVYVCSGFVCAAPATDAHMVRTAVLNAIAT